MDRAIKDTTILEQFVKDFVRVLEKHAKYVIVSGFECVQGVDGKDIYDLYLNDNAGIRYVRKGEFVPEMEVKLAKDSIDEEQLRKRTKLPFTGLDVYFSPIEANIAFKEELLKSEKDMADAFFLRKVYAKKLDEKEILRIKNDIKRKRLT